MRRRLLAGAALLAATASCERPTAPTAYVYTDRAVVIPAASQGWRAASVGGAHSCGIRTDGALYCWGSNTSGQLGITVTRGHCGRRGTACEASPVRVASGERFSVVSAGLRHTCAVSVARTLFCWGENLQFQTAVQAPPFVTAPTAIATSMQFTDVGAGLSHSCAVRTNGVIYCWGEGRLGALGRGDTVSSVIPAPIATDTRFVHVRSGMWRSCGIALDGALWCWGSEWESSSGGLDYFHPRLLPHRVDGLPPVRDVSVGATSICAVTVDDIAYCWEGNALAQLGLGTLDGTATPTPVATNERFTSVSVGIVQSCGITEDGRAFCWGNDSFGQLGVPRTGESCGPLECSRRPAQVFGRLRFTSAGTGPGTHSCGVTDVTALVCWGLGTEGQLGNGDAPERQSLPTGVLTPGS